MKAKKHGSARARKVYGVLVSHYNHYESRMVAHFDQYFTDRKLAKAYAETFTHADVVSIRVLDRLPKPKPVKREKRWRQKGFIR